MIYPKLLDQKHLDFINDQFGFSFTNSEQIDGLNDEEYDDLFEKLADIEVDEAAENGRSERGDLAAYIVTYMAGPFDPDNDWVAPDSSDAGTEPSEDNVA